MATRRVLRTRPSRGVNRAERPDGRRSWTTGPPGTRYLRPRGSPLPASGRLSSGLLEDLTRRPKSRGQLRRSRERSQRAADRLRHGHPSTRRVDSVQVPHRLEPPPLTNLVDWAALAAERPTARELRRQLDEQRCADTRLVERPARGWISPRAWCGSWCELESNNADRALSVISRRAKVAGGSPSARRKLPSGGGSAGSNPVGGTTLDLQLLPCATGQVVRCGGLMQSIVLRTHSTNRSTSILYLVSLAPTVSSSAPVPQLTAPERMARQPTGQEFEAGMSGSQGRRSSWTPTHHHSRCRLI
jgi:hypothetical protein